jgi:hypothetical protein
MALFPGVTKNYTQQLHTIKNRRRLVQLKALLSTDHRSAMPTSNNPDINIEYSSAIKEKLQ